MNAAKIRKIKSSISFSSCTTSTAIPVGTSMLCTSSSISSRAASSKSFDSLMSELNI